jgi:hypothetical protein
MSRLESVYTELKSKNLMGLIYVYVYVCICMCMCLCMCIYLAYLAFVLPA